MHLQKFSFTHLVLQNLFLVLLWKCSTQGLSVFIIEFEQLNTGRKGLELNWKFHVFFIFDVLVPLFRPSVFRVVLFFYISIYRG